MFMDCVWQNTSLLFFSLKANIRRCLWRKVGKGPEPKIAIRFLECKRNAFGTEFSMHEYKGSILSVGKEEERTGEDRTREERTGQERTGEVI